MMQQLSSLREAVCEANLALVRHGLVLFTWGNVSAIDPSRRYVVIKPSGVSYETMSADDMVVVDLEGRVVDGRWRPSSDTPTHLALYRAFPAIGGVVHTHSTHATAWAQALRAIPNLGTTHSDYFADAIPCSRPLTPEEICDDYEGATGRALVELFVERDPMHVPSALAAHHGPFSWGREASEAVHNAVVLEEVARMAMMTLQLCPDVQMNPHQVRKHFLRKHGPNAYYGQR